MCNACRDYGGHWIRESKRLALYLRGGFRCVYCQRKQGKRAKRRLHIDHVTPRSRFDHWEERFQLHHESNLVIACQTCNDEKGARTVGEYTQWLVARGRLSRQQGYELCVRVDAQRRAPLDRSTARALGTWIKTEPSNDNGSKRKSKAAPSLPGVT